MLFGHSNNLCSSLTALNQDEFQYGSLRDVSVEILPAANSEIIEVLDDMASCNM